MKLSKNVPGLYKSSNTAAVMKLYHVSMCSVQFSLVSPVGHENARVDNFLRHVSLDTDVIFGDLYCQETRSNH